MNAITATLSADQMTCTFPDGVRAVFNAPLPDLMEDEQGGGVYLTIYGSDGSTCGQLSVQAFTGDDETVINNDAGWEANYNDGNYGLGCLSKTYSASMNDIDACDPSVIVPGFSIEVAGSAYSFTLSSAATVSALFTCQ
jgi:hypothetical protein